MKNQEALAAEQTLPPRTTGSVGAHTPGPWSIGMSCDHTPAITVPVPASEGSGFIVAHVNRLPRLGSVRGDMDANARLIAAAPDMLAEAEQSAATFEAIAKALRELGIEKLADLCFTDMMHDAQARARANRAAIARATGAQS